MKWYDNSYDNKINAIEDKIPSVTGVATTATLNA